MIPLEISDVLSWRGLGIAKRNLYSLWTKTWNKWKGKFLIYQFCAFGSGRQELSLPQGKVQEEIQVSLCYFFFFHQWGSLHQNLSFGKNVVLTVYQSDISLFLYFCITNYPKTQRLKATHMYYVTVPVGQESGPRFSRSSVSHSVMGSNNGIEWSRDHPKAWVR